MAEAKRIFGVGFLFALLLSASSALAQNPYCAPSGKGLRAGSTAIDTGALIPGFHCPAAGKGDGKCVEWTGNAPDIGACEFGTPPGQIVSYALAISQTTVAPGANISGTWTVSGSPLAKDWVGLYKVGDPDATFDQTKWVYTNGTTSGTFTTTAPLVAGQYEFRYLTNDGFVSNAKSPAVTVSAVIVPPPPPLTGLVDGSVTINGEVRTYQVYVPANLPAGPRPTVVALHGGTNQKNWVGNSGLTPLAEADKWIIVYPAAATSRGGLWQGGLTTAIQGSDDSAFVQSLIATLPAKHPIDVNRLYVIGGSNGGMMAMRVMCEMSDKFLGLVTGQASMTSWLASRCAPTAPRPVAIVHGDSDGTTPYACTVATGCPAGNQVMSGTVIGAARTAALFAASNKCATTPVDTTIGSAPTIVLHSYGGCPNPVSLYQMVTIGHAWPQPQYAVNSTVIWQWFKAIPLVVVPPPPPQNAAPVVKAGPDMTITLPASAILTGTVTDDGLPIGSKLTAAWAKVSGPGVVTFVANPTAGTTTANFSAAGSYVLSLCGSDGAFTVCDEMLVLVNPAIVVPPPPPPVVKEFNVTTTLKSLTITRRANQTVGKVTVPEDMKVKCNNNEATMTATTVVCP